MQVIDNATQTYIQDRSGTFVVGVRNYAATYTFPNPAQALAAGRQLVANLENWGRPTQPPNIDARDQIKRFWDGYQGAAEGTIPSGTSGGGSMPSWAPLAIGAGVVYYLSRRGRR